VGEVIEFSSPERHVWRCGCGCLSFYVGDDRELQCCNCEEIVKGNGTWRSPPDFTGGVNDEEHAFIKVEQADRSLEDEIFMRSLRAGEFIALVGLRPGGGVSICKSESFDTRQQRGWVRRRLEEARKHLVGDHGE